MCKQLAHFEVDCLLPMEIISIHDE